MLSVAYMALNNPAPTFYLTLASLFFDHSTAATMDSLMFLEHTRITPFLKVFS